MKLTKVRIIRAHVTFPLEVHRFPVLVVFS
jgi:hypothetical protein